MADHCSSTFSRYFVPAVIAGTHSVPLHTRVWRDFPLGWLVLEALQEGVAYKKRAPLLALGLQKFQRELWIRVRVDTYFLSLYLSLVCV